MRVLPRKNMKSALLRSASTAAIVVLASFATTAQAQLRPNPTITAPRIAPRAAPGQIRSVGATDALARQVATRTRAQQIRAFATQARAAVRSAPNGLATSVVGSDGVSIVAGNAGGLVPVMRAREAFAWQARAAALRSKTNPAQADLDAAKAAEDKAADLARQMLAVNDSTGRSTWQGASAPTETSNGDAKLVTINQNEARAILSWDRFDVGTNTTLQFNQKLNGVAQKDWVAVNRVIDPTMSPSLILGSIVADATVVVVNRNGMIFGNGAKVNTNALLASSLDIGNFAKLGNVLAPNGTDANQGFVAATTQERNMAFLQEGLLQPALSQQAKMAGMLVSAEAQGTARQQNAAEIEAMLRGSAPAPGAVTVEGGANITAGKGGFVILTSPKVTNHGTLSATEGQVSLQAGLAVSHTVSTGAAEGDVRGLILRTPFDGADSQVVNKGLIETPRGYASLGTSLKGSVENSGLIAATTSVSRNGTVSLTGGRITLTGSTNPAEAGGIVILPDENGETIPLGTPSEPANFRPSQIAIGGIYIDINVIGTAAAGELGPASIALGANSLIHAPGAKVNIGGQAGTAYLEDRYADTGFANAIETLAASKIDIANGALIDVSGIKDVQLAASRNSVRIDPLKRNELRDTPNYREVLTNGEFTLNGAAIYVDPRISGVRDDGVAYVGSPLIEAGSAAGQIGITATEFMTKGGTINLSVGSLAQPRSLDIAPKVTIARGATLDLSGGWVAFASGIVRTSRLLTVDGRVVDIADADPNDRFVAVGDGFNEVQTKFGISRVYANSILQGARFEQGYDEGRDAGALSIGAPAATFEGTLYGQAFAGVRQLAAAKRPLAAAKTAGDLRGLQTTTTDLPSGASLRIGTYGSELAADIVVGPASSTMPEGAIHLDDVMLSNAGLSALTLRTSAGVQFAAGSKVTLANGGALSVEAGRTIRFDGDVTAASGSITAKTLDFNTATGSLPAPQGSRGSPFRSDDDIFKEYAEDPGLSPLDIIVGGKLSTAGLWTNDFLSTGFGGKGWTDGGSISLTTAPSVFAYITGLINATDLSGSIRIDRNALLDVSSGGYVGTDGSFDLAAHGGNVSLINETVYASSALTDLDTTSSSTAKEPLGGGNQTVTFTEYGVSEARVRSRLTVAEARSEVSFDASSIKGFGFDGGGTFKLVAPDIVMGSDTGGKGPKVGLDFLQRTGFGTLDLTAVKSRIVSGLFDNGNSGNSAFHETSRFVVSANQTLDLTQTVLPKLFDSATRATLLQAGTGTAIASVLTPGVPDAPWDRRAANLKLGGLTELDVEAGGEITGASNPDGTGASITIPRLYNAGTIRIAGGSLVQNDPFLSNPLHSRFVGVRDVSLGGGGLSDILSGGSAGQTSGFAEGATAALVLFGQNGERLTNGQLFSYVRPSGGDSTDVKVIFTGRVALNEGIHLAAGSSIDLSGTVITDPRAPLLANGRQQRLGRMVAGGTISTSDRGSATAASGYASPIDPGNRLVAEAGATIALNGAGGVFDERVSAASIAPVAHWSDAGKLIIGNGAQLTGAAISAFGGDDGDADLTRTKAFGGLLDWTAPIIRQTDDGTTSDASTLFVDQMFGNGLDDKGAGFDSLVARGSVTTVGSVNLTLGKSFIATTENLSGGLRTVNSLTVSVKSDATATDPMVSITAPYIHLASTGRTLSSLLPASSPGFLSLTAKAIDIVGSVGFSVGDPTKGAARGRVRLEAEGDIRLIGTQGIPDNNNVLTPGLTGQLVSNGDLWFKAGQVYATTGTGNLQQLLEDRRSGKTSAVMPYVIASSNAAGIVRFERQEGVIPDTPYSAGSYLRVLGANILQNGVLRAPLGLLEIGANQTTTIAGNLSAPATQSLSFGPTSLTSVSARAKLTGNPAVDAAALDIPYGTTTDLIEYFFNPGTASVLTTMPVGELRIAGKDVVIANGGNGIRLDGRGGGDVFAFEFIPSTGGSRDILDRLNPDQFSSTNGFQFPDGRQVYAIVPKSSATAAMFDPIYSAGYSGGDDVYLYGADAGLSVRLDAAPGIEAGDYLLLPAHYALLPGAMRVVENVGADAPYDGAGMQLLDGSVMVGGVYTTAGTGFAQSQRRSFTVQSQDVIAKYSRIGTTSGSESVADLAEHKGLTVPALPRDAARVVLAPLNSLKVAGAFATDAAKGGLGSRVDLSGTKIRIGTEATFAEEAKALADNGIVADPATEGFLKLSTEVVEKFNASSLSIGALRTDNIDGTTSLDVVAETIVVDNNVRLAAPELLLAVDSDTNSLLQIRDAARGTTTGAQLIATGTLDDRRTGDYIIKTNTSASDQSGAGAFIRISTGPERLVRREGVLADRNSLRPSRLDIGSHASITGATITLDSSRLFNIATTAKFGALEPGGEFMLAVSGDQLRVGGPNFRPEILAQFAQASKLTLRSPDVVNFDPGEYRFKDLTIDAAAIGHFDPFVIPNGDVKLIADDVVLKNSFADRGGCRAVGFHSCSGEYLLNIDASTITFGSGTIRTDGFYQRYDPSSQTNVPAVTLAARNGMFVSGKGSFTTASTFDSSVDPSLHLITPFIVDRLEGDLLGDYIRPEYTFDVPGAFAISGPAGAVLPTGGEAPSARLSFKSSSFDGISIENTAIRATAGTIDITAWGNILLKGTASLVTPGYTKTFDDGVEQTTVSAGGGVINLVQTRNADGFSLGSIIDAEASTSLIVDNGIGKAGIINISAPEGEARVRSKLNIGVAANTDRSASFRLDAGNAEFDLSSFVADYGRLFQGDIAIRSGALDLELLAGQKIKADSLSLTADGGNVVIAGTIDTSGDDVSRLKVTDAAYGEARVNGGAISLFGRQGVSLASSASLLSTTSGYNALDTRQASGGTVTIGIGIPELAETPAARIDIASGAVIDVSARRGDGLTGDRTVTKIVPDSSTGLELLVNHIAPGDQGGLVNFRAPVLDDNTVNFVNRGKIGGARELSIEGYRRFDLEAIARSEQFSGVRIVDGTVIELNPGAILPEKANFLSGKDARLDDPYGVAEDTLPYFIRNFSISSPENGDLAGYRLRPGVELVSTGTGDVRDIRLVSEWNLGAGSISDANLEAAKNDGLLKESPLEFFQDGLLNGQKAYEVVYGKEGELFENYVDMLYRVKGSVRGEAPVITFRAAGDVRINRSITDGFFTFHDKTNSDYINYQLGGGDRTYNPALVLNCGTGLGADCASNTPFAESAPGIAATVPIDSRVTFTLTAQQGRESSDLFIQAPFNPLANAASPAATGDALGVGELFPLLEDGSSVHSSSIRIVGGALTNSANVLQVGSANSFNASSADPAAPDDGGLGSVFISGEKTYVVAPTHGGTSRFKGSLDIRFSEGTQSPAGWLFATLEEFAAGLEGSSGLGSAGPDDYTVLTWGGGTTGAAAKARELAREYPAFAADRFLGPRNGPVDRSTGVAARLADVVAFLIETGLGETFAENVSNGTPGYNAGPLREYMVRLVNPNIPVGTKVRTGDGTIDIAAANNIEMLRTPGITKRLAPTGEFQVGGTAVYTAGVRALPNDQRIAPDASMFVPGAPVGLPTAPVLAKNGGAISLTAGQDVIGRRDVFAEAGGLEGAALRLGGITVVDPVFISARGYGLNTTGGIFNAYGTTSILPITDQPWRYGKISSTEVEASIAPNFFTSGVGALSGGDVSVRAGRDLSDMTIALDNSLTTKVVEGRPSLVKLGNGNLTVEAGRNVAGGNFDIASGIATVNVGGDVLSSGSAGLGSFAGFLDQNLLRVRIADAVFNLSAKGSARIGGIGALGVGSSVSSSIGMFSALAGASIATSGDIYIAGNRRDQVILSGNAPIGYVLPPSLSLTAIAGDIGFIEPGTVDTTRALPRLVYGSEFGQLNILAGGNIEGLSLAMSDRAPANGFGGAELDTQFPAVYSDYSDDQLRALHDRRLLHRDDLEPARVVAGGSITDVVLSLPKASRIRADQDIVDLVFQGQHVRSSDITRISAGRDITGTVGLATGNSSARSGVRGNNFVLGGPGALFVEAGRDLGPFITSATGSVRTEAGGIRTVGNEMNPWLAPQGADLYVLFGVGQGADYAELERVYLDPANLAQLDGDLFVQVEDEFGNKSPDRSRYTYAPVLAEWLRENHPDAFATVFGNDAPSGDALAQASFARYGDLYAAFAGLDQSTGNRSARNRFLLDKLYFGELGSATEKGGVSENQYIRGYRAAQTLFPTNMGYTDNLATYTVGLADADHPLGYAAKNLVDTRTGEIVKPTLTRTGGRVTPDYGISDEELDFYVPQVADVKLTGNVDLRLSTIQTARGGDVTILGPGGNFIAGSVVRTSAQIARRASAFNISAQPFLTANTDLQAGIYFAALEAARGEIKSIPQGYEGILTLRGGEIRSFTDGSFVLNQSRLFTLAGGDIALWTSNGDLNAGQGPRSSSNFPPIVLRFSPNGSSQVNSAGSVSGAGIGAFKSSPDDPNATIRLMAPVGTVDAGDAGVRASGDIFVAAARVANADNFTAGGTISGVPSAAATAAPPVPASAASAIVANAVRAASAGDNADRLSRIFVDVLGYFGSDRQDCPAGQSADADGECKADGAR